MTNAPRLNWLQKINTRIAMSAVGAQVSVTQNGRAQPYVARETSGAERDLCWQVALQTYPGYAAYKQRTDRQIPVIVLTPQAA